MRSFIQSIFVFLVLSTVPCELNAQAPGESISFRVMTYNIHHGRGADNAIDLERIARIIKQSKAELVALQEVDKNTTRSGAVDQLARLAELTSMNFAFGKAIDYAGGEYGVGVLSLPAIIASRTHRLPSSEGHEPRVALETEIQLPNESVLTFVSTHLDHTRDSNERSLQMAELNRVFASRDQTRIILAGDLNAGRNSAELKILLDHWRPASLNSPAPTIPADRPTQQIDYVMLRKRDAWNVDGTKVLNYPIASDHAPVVATLHAVPNSEFKRSDLLSATLAGQIPSRDDWESQRSEILNAMQQIMGRFPGDDKRCDLDVAVNEVVDCGSYERKLISYASESGSRVPAYLLVPKSVSNSESILPAVLCLHPTDDRVGHKVVVGLGGKPNRKYAHELAERGYVTIAPAYPQLANYQPNLLQLGYQSGTMKAIWDNVRAIDLLESMPYVSKGGVGVIGHSLGGHNGVYTAAFDQRIKVVVSSCGLDSYQDYMNGDIRGWTNERYMPRLLEYSHRLHQLPFDFHHVLALIAPRPCFISAPIGDSNFQWKSVDRVAEAARAVYRLYTVEESLVVQHPDCGHDFPREVRDQAYDFIDGVLK